ncbi:MAG: CD225/dispanin family protein [Clostridia bacterium]|nr:CD225/dispanin family protein [Clostridia bacterium]
MHQGGQPSYGTQPPIYGQQPYGAPQPIYPPVPKPSMSWLIVNIVLTVLSGCTNLLAIVGIVFGALGQSAYTKGKYEDAKSHTKTCRTFAIISLTLSALTVLAGILYVVLVALGSFSAISGGFYYA